MGDMADYFRDQAFDDWLDDQDGLSLIGGEEMDFPDAYDYRCDPLAPSNKSIECRYCHKDDLYWDETKWGSRLFEPNGQLHRCEEYRNYKKNDPEDFEDPPYGFHSN